MIRACALIAVLISGALIDVARGADRVECEPQRVTGDGHYWAYRIVDGRECWYPGRPGKPKNELFWGRGITPSARQPVDQPEAETEPSEPPSRFVSAPPEQPERATRNHRGNAEAMARERSRPAACVHLLLAGVGGARPAPKADIRAAGLAAGAATARPLPAVVDC
jgi:hypothetical protein